MWCEGIVFSNRLHPMHFQWNCYIATYPTMLIFYVMSTFRYWSKYMVGNLKYNTHNILFLCYIIIKRYQNIFSKYYIFIAISTGTQDRTTIDNNQYTFKSQGHLYLQAKGYLGSRKLELQDEISQPMVPYLMKYFPGHGHSSAPFQTD